MIDLGTVKMISAGLTCGLAGLKFVLQWGRARARTRAKRLKDIAAAHREDSLGELAGRLQKRFDASVARWEERMERVTISGLGLVAMTAALSAGSKGD